MEKIYIALDLETTGFEPLTDEVLEIAAIKFQGDKILETFETLVRPGIDIPAMVTHITGITAETVQEAPSFEDIRANLTLFLGNYPIVGHNIEFDLTFLEAKGIPILSPQLDTLKLSSLLLPNLPSYSLDTISRQLKITHENKHRAYSDALVCVELFRLLLQKIALIPAPVLSKIQQLIPRATWDLGEIFLEAKGAATGAKPHQKQSDDVSPDTVLLSESDDILELLGPKSPLSQILKNYEYRPGQQTFFQKILNASNENYHLIAEAGTGTGKTMAYLLAAAALRQTKKKKIIISTYTNNLQDQIIHKDFPLIQKLFPKISITVLKGRKKYLDRERLDKLFQKPNLEEHELTSLIKILFWLEETTTGDLDELNLQNKEILIYDQICSDPDDKQGHPPGQSSFLELARQKADNADIVVVNHALLIQDSLSGNGLLPEADVLIIDEAHHLERTITDAKTISFSENRAYRIWDSLFEEIVKNNQLEKLAPDKSQRLQEDLKKHRLHTLNLAQKLFQAIGLIMEKFAGNYPGQSLRLAINQQIAEDTHWHKVMDYVREFTLSHKEIGQICKELTSTLLQQDLNDNRKSSVIRDLQDFFQQMQDLLDSPANKIVWISKNFDESLHLSYAPLTVDSVFQEQISSNFHTIVLTSATLSTYGNFSYLRHELGLGENFDEIKIPSHFSYPDQVKIIIPEDLSDPRAPGYLPECRDIIHEVIRKNGGRTLVLFTAKKELARVFHDLAAPLKNEGISLLAQNISGGRGKILSHFQDDPDHCAILGTNSFWEGVDLIGPVLTCVVIQKLPFDPPDDPIIKARSVRFAKPFEEYALPRAILRFKQGFGRLIRSASDTGAVIILDSRLVQKSYGQEFISSLPEGIKIHQCQRQNVAEQL